LACDHIHPPSSYGLIWPLLFFFPLGQISLCFPLVRIYMVALKIYSNNSGKSPHLQTINYIYKDVISLWGNIYRVWVLGSIIFGIGVFFNLPDSALWLRKILLHLLYKIPPPSPNISKSLELGGEMTQTLYAHMNKRKKKVLNHCKVISNPKISSK
jgi:hypothetical protein